MRKQGSTETLAIEDQRRHNFFITDNEVIDVFGPDLGFAAIAVYAVLCRFSNANSGECRVLVSTIAQRIGMSDRGVRNQLSTLVAAGLISKKKHFGGASTYALRQVPKSSKDTVRQQVPDCSIRQQVPDDSAVIAGKSGNRCRQNKTSSNKTSSLKRGKKTPTLIHRKAVAVLDHLDVPYSAGITDMTEQAIGHYIRKYSVTADEAAMNIERGWRVQKSARSFRFWLEDGGHMELSPEASVALTKGWMKA